MERRGIDVFYGDAVFKSDHDLSVSGETISGDRFIIAAGAEPIIPEISGLERTGFWTSFNAVNPDRQPESLIVIGGSSIGCEFAQIYSRLGTRVTVVEMKRQLIYGEDSDNARQLEDLLSSEGIEVMLASRATESESGAENKRVTIENADGGATITADELLIAAGRKPACERLGLEAAGVRISEGAVAVDDNLLTSQPHIWACGDITGKPMLSHLASYEGNVAGNNAAASVEAELVAVDYSGVPAAIFTDPPVASVGITEVAAREAGMDVAVGIARYGDSGRAAALGERIGQVKIVVEKDSRQILGAHIFGAGADAIIHEVVVAMGSGLGVDALLRPRAIHIHPTLSELIGSAAAAAR